MVDSGFFVASIGTFTPVTTSDPSPPSVHPARLGAAVLWNGLQTIASVGLVLGVPLAYLWGMRLSEHMRDAWYVPTFLMMLQGALLLVIAPTALLHSQRLRARGARPAGLLRWLFRINAVATACTFGYLAWGVYASFG